MYILPDGYEVDDPSLNDIKVGIPRSMNDLTKCPLISRIVRFEPHIDQATSQQLGCQPESVLRSQQQKVSSW